MPNQVQMELRKSGVERKLEKDRLHMIYIKI